MRASKLITAVIAGVAVLATVPAIAGPGLDGAHDASATADRVGALDGELARQLEAAGAGDELLVYLHAATIDDAVEATRASGLTLVDTFERVAVAVAVGTPARIREAAARPETTYVEADREMRFFLDTSHDATRGEQVLQGWTDPAHGQVGPFDGSGMSIAIVDSGIDGSHPMFQVGGESKVVRNLKFSCAFFFDCDGSEGNTRDELWVDMTGAGNDTDTGSLGGHGTHVAGIAAGSVVEADGRTLHGAAPGARLVGLSVGQFRSVYAGFAGLNWVLEHHAAPCGPEVSADACPPIRVVNNSWGPVGGGEYDPAGVVTKLEHALVAEGVVVVWAAGNDGGDGSSVLTNPPGQSPVPGVLMAANYDDTGGGVRDGSLNTTSSRGADGRPGTYPDISAPGTDILSACRATLVLCEGRGDYAQFTGTSMAAPHIAGIAAQLLDARPDLTPGQVEAVLTGTAYRFGAGGDYERTLEGRITSFDKGAGLVDVAAAISYLLSVDAPATGRSCRRDEPVVDDPEGDATWFIVETPRPSEPTLDVLRVRPTFDGKTLTISMRIADLQTFPPPPGSNGIAFDVELQRGREHWLLRAIADPGLLAGFSVDVTRADGTAVEIEGVDGSFDDDTDIVTVTVPNDGLEAAELQPLGGKDVLEAFAVTAWRVEGALLAGVDLAGGRCAFSLAKGTTTTPVTVDRQPPKLPKPHATLTDGATFTREDDRPPGDTSAYSCTGPNDPACITYVLDLRPADGRGVLDLTLTSDLVGTAFEDFDVFVYDLDGRQLGGSGNPQTIEESASVPIDNAGLYYVVVQPFTATPDSPYTLTATLN